MSTNLDNGFILFSLLIMMFVLFSLDHCPWAFVCKHIIIILIWRGLWFVAFLWLITKVFIHFKIVLFFWYFLYNTLSNKGAYIRIIFCPLFFLLFLLFLFFLWRLRICCIFFGFSCFIAISFAFFTILGCYYIMLLMPPLTIIIFQKILLISLKFI